MKETISSDRIALLQDCIEAGDEIQIWPRVGPGMSRDTEPGLQPWKAKPIGYLWLNDILHVAIESRESEQGYRLVGWELVTLPSLT